MQTNDVYYSQRPGKFAVSRNDGKALIEFPVNVSEVETEDGTQWKAETVYSVETMDHAGLEERVEANYDAWLDRAKEVEPQTASLTDVVDALNALTDLILGGV